MSVYNRIFKLKSCLGSLRNLKNINKVNDTLSKEIDVLCSKNKPLQDSNKSLGKLKELNKFLSKEFKKFTTNTEANLSVEKANSQTKLEQTCRPLYSLPESLEEKNELHKRKYLKSRHIKKEIEKLCKHLTNKHVFGSTAFLSASGLTLKDDISKTANSDSSFSNDTNASEVSNHYFKTTGSLPDGGVTDPIPEPPPVPDWAAESLNQLNALGEPTFASLGLGGSSPVGILQKCMEYLHVTMGMEWWLTIVLSTLIIRICLFPLVVLAQRNAAKMNNILPQMQMLQMKISEARQTGDAIGAARYSQELMTFMNEKGVNPIKNMIVPLVQAPIFISFFMALRQMSNVPVDSLRTGGIFWFTDLTLPDQFYLMPIITSLTLWATIEVGTDSAKLSSQNVVLVKYILRAMPVVILPFTLNFPGAILCYWVSSNFISLLQVSFLRIPKVRNYFKIEPMMTFSPEQLPVKPKGFTEGLKDSWTNIKITREIEERRRLDEMQFKQAGKGPLQKTYKYDPTKQMSPVAGTKAPISAKKRS